jgi:hypothetical protein
MTFTLTIEMDNDAFWSDLYLYNSKELQRVLKAVGQQVDRETDDHFLGPQDALNTWIMKGRVGPEPLQPLVEYGCPVLDCNGTSVGRWTLHSD